MTRKFKRENKREEKNQINLKEQIDYSDLYIIYIKNIVKMIENTLLIITFILKI